MNIPYTSVARTDTGVTNPTLGIWLFIASEVMLFGSLFSSYALLRSGAASWPDQSAVLNVGLAGFNTVILVSSSLAIIAAGKALTARDLARCRRYLGITILCGLAFLTLKAVEYRQDFQEGLVPSANNFLGLYFTMTGLHALHVLGGALVNAFLWGPGSRMWQAEPERYAGRVAVAAVYWNFVDLVWLVMFTVLYLF